MSNDVLKGLEMPDDWIVHGLTWDAEQGIVAIKVVNPGKKAYPIQMLIKLDSAFFERKYQDEVGGGIIRPH